MEELSRALKIYLNRPTSSYPQAREEDVERSFGADEARRVTELVEEVGALDVDWHAHSLTSATAWAKVQMQLRHPDLASDAVTDLGWVFSYSWK